MTCPAARIRPQPYRSTRMAAAPWFCVKSTLLADTSPNSAPESHKKVFINICTRPTVPKAEELADNVLHDRLETPSESDPYLIPTVLAESREDVDKGASNGNGGPDLTRLFFSKPASHALLSTASSTHRARYWNRNMEIYSRRTSSVRLLRVLNQPRTLLTSSPLQSRRPRPSREKAVLAAI